MGLFARYRTADRIEKMSAEMEKLYDFAKVTLKQTFYN